MLTIVTGGGRGIGAAVCRWLAADGHDLMVGYRNDQAAAEVVAAAGRTTGVRAVAMQAEATDESSVKRLVESAMELGALTGLVTSAGAVTAVGPLRDNDLTAIRRDLDVNVFGVLSCIKHASEAMATGGAIVAISSSAATLGSPGEYVHYAAAKAAVDALTVSLAKELAPDGIRINAVAPGIIRTGFRQDPKRPDRLAHTIPQGRPGEPGEVAAAIAWLLSDAASYTTGAVLRMAGGR